MDGVINFLKKKRDDIARSVMDDKGLMQRGQFTPLRAIPGVNRANQFLVDNTIKPMAQNTYNTAKPILNYLDPRGYQAERQDTRRGLQSLGTQKLLGASKAMVPTAVNLFGYSKLGPAAVGVSGLIGGGISKVTGNSFGEGWKQGVGVSPTLAGIGSISSPLINRTVSRFAPNLSSPVGKFLANRTLTGALNMPEGAVYNSALGREGYNLKDAGIDFAMGAIGGAGAPNARLKAKGFGELYQSDIKNVRDVLSKLQTNFKRADGTIDTKAFQRAIDDAEIYRKSFKLADNKEWKTLSLPDKYKMIASKMQDLRSSGEGIQMGIYGGPQAKQGKPTFSSLADKKPRFEIDDSGAKLKGSLEDIINKMPYEQKLKVLGSGQGVKLGELLDHPELFKNYPELKNISVKQLNLEHSGNQGTVGSYSPEFNQITVSAERMGGKWGDKEKSILLHEIQHAIQQKEGFARGGSPENSVDPRQISQIDDLDQFGNGKHIETVVLNDKKLIPVINPGQMIAKKKLPGIMFTTSKTKAEGRKMKITEPTAESKPLPWETKIHKETGITLPPKSNKPPQGEAPRDTDVLLQFKQIIQDWRNRVLAGKQEADLTSTIFSKLPDEDGYKIVKYLENPTPEKAKQLGLDINKYQGEVNAIRGYYNSIRQEGLQRGLDIKYLNNYINHVWKETPKEIFDLIDKNVKAIGKTPSFVKERRIPTYEEGLAVGLTPKFTHPAQLASHYRMQLERATAAKNLVDELSKSGIVQSVDRAPLGWKVIDAPLVPDLNGKFAPQKVAEQLSNVFGQAPDNAFTKTVDFTANVSKIMQDVTLSGGIRTLNAFSLGNLVKEFTAGRIVGPLKAFGRSFTDGSSASYFKENGQVLTELAERGVPIRTNLDYTQAYKNMAESPTIQKTIGQLWSDNINKPTFARFLPMLQVEFYKDARKAGMNADQAAKATKNFYGVVDNFTRSKQAENVLSTIFFAPRFRESMINFWLNNARSLKNPTNPEVRGNQAFIAGTITSYILYSYLNKQLTGRYMHENKEGKEFSIEIPRGEGRSWYIPMLPSIGTIPRRVVEMGSALLQGDVAGATQKAGSFFSQPVSLGSQLLTNRTFYGGPIYNEEDSAPAKIGKLAGYGVGQSLHPFLGEPIEVMQGRKTPTEAGLGMLEMPVYPSRSTDTAGLTGTQYNKYRELAKNNQGDAERYLRVSLGNKEQNKLDSKENAKRKAIKEGTATLKEAPQTSWIDNAFSVFASGKEQTPTKSANTQRIDDLIFAYKLEKYAGAPPSDPLKKITFDREKLSKAKSIFKSEDVNDQERQGMIERLGYNIDDVKYDVASSLSTAERASYMVERMKSMDEKRAKQFLEETRTKSLSDKTMGTKAVYDLLIENGYMDKGTRDYLLSFELEKDSKTRKSTKKNTGKGRKIKIGTTPKSPTVKVSFSSSPVSTGGIKMQAPKINVNIPSRNRRTGAKGKPKIGMMQVKGVKKIKFA